MTPTANHVRITAVVLGAVYSGLLFLSGIRLDSWEKHALAILPTVSAVAVVVFDKWIWCWPILLRVHGHPRLDGLWHASLVPHGESKIPPEGNWTPEAYVVIEASFWTTSVVLHTDQSSSFSRASTFLRRGTSSQWALSFLYDNTPRQEHQPRSWSHAGACELHVPLGAPVRLTGTYFTDRFTQGEMKLDLIDRSTNFPNFSSAEAYARDLADRGKSSD